MPTFLHTLDPTDEAVGNVAFELEDEDNGVRVVDFKDPRPEKDISTAASASTEGDPYGAPPRYRNRTFTYKILILQTADSLLENIVGALQEKVAKIAREGGTLRVITPNETAVTFDLVDADIALPKDWYYVHRSMLMVDLVLTGLPHGRGRTILNADSNTETSLPVNVMTVDSIGGDVPALGKLYITEPEGTKDRWSWAWGVQSRYYDPSPNAALHFDAKDREYFQAGAGAVAAIADNPSIGVFFAGGTAIRWANFQSRDFQALMSTQGIGGGSHHRHVGGYQVWARLGLENTLITSPPDVQARLDWVQGDFNSYTVNDPVTMKAPPSNQPVAMFTVPLGVVRLDPAPVGQQQRWEGRFSFSSGTATWNRTVGALSIYIDDYWLQPIDEGSGRGDAISRFITPTTFVARDSFEQNSGTLTGRVADAGGTWIGAGDATDYGFDATGLYAVRTALADTDLNSGRLETLGTAQYASVCVHADVSTDKTPSTLVSEGDLGVIARYKGTAAHVRAVYDYGGVSSAAEYLRIVKVTGGVHREIAIATVPRVPAQQWQGIRLQIDTTGRLAAWIYPTGAVMPGQPTIELYDGDFAAGGTLDTGTTGIYDAWQVADPCTRRIDNFWAGSVTPDAALFAGGTALVTHDSARRSAGGTVYGAVSRYEGNYFKISPAGQEGRVARVIAFASRSRFGGEMATPSIDDLGMRVDYTERYLDIPR